MTLKISLRYHFIKEISILYRTVKMIKVPVPNYALKKKSLFTVTV